MTRHFTLTAMLIAISFSAAAQDASVVWTEDDIKATCLDRAQKEPGSSSAFQRCMDRNLRKIGQNKTAGEMVESRNAMEKIKAAAEARAAELEAMKKDPYSE